MSFLFLRYCPRSSLIVPRSSALFIFFKSKQPSLESSSKWTLRTFWSPSTYLLHLISPSLPLPLSPVYRVLHHHLRHKHLLSSTLGPKLISSINPSHRSSPTFSPTGFTQQILVVFWFSWARRFIFYFYMSYIKMILASFRRSPRRQMCPAAGRRRRSSSADRSVQTSDNNHRPCEQVHKPNNRQ